MDTTMLTEASDVEFSYVKTLRLGCLIAGIEMCYAAESVFATPKLLSLGIPVQFMTLAWVCGPLLGGIITPIYGSLSDGCTSRLGRRRPFIIITGICIIIGMLLIQNGKLLGVLLGDVYPDSHSKYTSCNSSNNTIVDVQNSTQVLSDDMTNMTQSNPLGIFFTILGLALLDSNCDCGQSPSRAYMFDVTGSKHHSKGLTMLTLMGGIAGCLGYMCGYVNWEDSALGQITGESTTIFFIMIIILYIICLVIGIMAVREIPLPKKNKRGTPKKTGLKTISYIYLNETFPEIEYMSFDDEQTQSHDDQASYPESRTDEEPMSFKSNMASILFMPKPIAILFVNSIFCWIALCSYFAYFSDFVGQSVFHGVPVNTDCEAHALYQEGVRWGSLCMAFQCAACAGISLCIDNLIRKFGMKIVFVTVQMLFMCGSLVMALTKNKFAVLFLSITPGMLDATIYNIPYTLVANYHSSGMFKTTDSRPRGLGTDVAILTSGMFVAQILLNSAMGVVIDATGTTAAVMFTSTIFTAFATFSSIYIVYT